MRFQINTPKKVAHTEIVTTIGWCSSDEAISASDDHQVIKWNAAGESSVFMKLGNESYATGLHWLPVLTTGGGTSAKRGSDMMAMALADGKINLISRGARIEKTFEAHHGAVLTVRWSGDATALMSSGEDGSVKIWSRSGMLRTTLAQGLEHAVYAACWGPDNDQVLYSQSNILIIRNMQPTSKPIQWKAHEGVILCVDWNVANGYIVSGGEDCTYRVWDGLGRSIYNSSAQKYPITSCSWAPDGSVFAVGSFNSLRLCDKAGWSESLEKCSTGSVLALSWSSDGTQISCAGGNGQVVFGCIVDKIAQWKHLEVKVTGKQQAHVRNALSWTTADKLDFKDRIIQVSLGYDHLIVATASLCYIYRSKNWNTPLIFDLKEGAVSFILQSEKYFLLGDGTGLYIYGYDGRLASSPKLPGLRVDLLSRRLISLCSDTLAVRDKGDKKQIHLLEVATGKPVGDGKNLLHTQEVCEVALDHMGPGQDRRIAFIDSASDLYIGQVRPFGSARKTFKLSSMMEGISWNDHCNVLCALGDAKLEVWTYPNVAFSDRDLLENTVLTTPLDKRQYGREPLLLSYVGSQVTLRRSDGCVLYVNVSPYPVQLHAQVTAGKWNDAVRLCRFVREKWLWSCLAAMAAYSKDLKTAEIAYAAVDDAVKVQHVQSIRELPVKEARNAELALLYGGVQDAEGILLQASLIFRAIFMNIQLYNWERALELAVKHKTHVDTVLAYRKKYLEKFGRSENNKRFQQYAEGVEIDWNKIEQKIELEYQKERERPAAPAATTTPAVRKPVGAR